ncbi:unnamed protein product [Rotaria magnacalcarata]|uniref:Reverse transcriptase domain-containing protein n=2 Tax=Rotaria magnacalcarata TaxID=392030 RepID=A0A8S2QCD7_9BILA|nr:unnamed protein product [Rotaria magnacalcarata]
MKQIKIFTLHRYSTMLWFSPVVVRPHPYVDAPAVQCFEGCLGKLTRMGIPNVYVKWIQTWGGPQGSSLTPTLFITYHSDMADFIPGAMSFFFADDLAAVLAGQIGLKFAEQCVDLERILQTFFKQLEFYSILAVQPINYAKTQIMFSARAVCYPNPMPQVRCEDNAIE